MSGSIVAVAGRGLKLKTFQRVGRLNSRSLKRGRQCLIAMQRARHAYEYECTYANSSVQD